LRLKLYIFSSLLSFIILVSPAFALEIERPSNDIDIGKRVESSDTNNVASVGLGVDVQEYFEDSTFPPVEGKDYVKLRAVATANSRKVITYEASPVPYRWRDVSTPTGIVGDNVGDWVNISHPFQFYGGPLSAHYQNVWICSNGYVCFDDSESTSSEPKYVPNPEKPNAIIAALWTDLEVDGEASITYDNVYLPEYGYNYFFIVSWNNVKHKLTWERLTFQLWLEYTRPELARGAIQHRIFISYESVGSLSYSFSAGIEDHEGLKGTFGLVSNGITVQYSQNSNSAYIKGLKINIEENDANAFIDISEDEDHIRGYNVVVQTPTYSDENHIYTQALNGDDVLLLVGKAGLILLKKAWKVVGGVLVETISVINLLSYHMLSNADAVIKDTDELPNGGSVEVSTIHTGMNPDRWVVDANIGVTIYWVLTDQNNQDHSLSITATADYVMYDEYANRIDDSYSTSVDLQVVRDAGNSFASARVVPALPAQYGAFVGITIPPPGTDDVKDFYRVNVPINHILKAEMTPPNNTNFDLYLYKGTYLANSSTNPLGVPESASALIYDGGWCYVEVRAQAGFGIYTLTISSEPSSLPPPPPGGPPPPHPMGVEIS